MSGRRGERCAALVGRPGVLVRPLLPWRAGGGSARCSSAPMRLAYFEAAAKQRSAPLCQATRAALPAMRLSRFAFRVLLRPGSRRDAGRSSCLTCCTICAPRLRGRAIFANSRVSPPVNTPATFVAYTVAMGTADAAAWRRCTPSVGGDQHRPRRARRSVSMPCWRPTHPAAEGRRCGSGPPRRSRPNLHAHRRAVYVTRCRPTEGIH